MFLSSVFIYIYIYILKQKTILKRILYYNIKHNILVIFTATSWKYKLKKFINYSFFLIQVSTITRDQKKKHV